MNFGYSCDFGEIAPSIFCDLSSQKQTKLFLALFNSCLEKSQRIPLRSANLGGIKSAINDRIGWLLSPKGYKKPGKIRYLDLSSSLIINAYKKADKQLLKELISSCASMPKLAAAQMIARCYQKGEFDLCFDAKKIFTNYVYDKILLKNKDKEVYLEHGLIYIKEKGTTRLIVMPCFAEIDCQKQESASLQIQNAIQIIKNKPGVQVYVVAPKSSKFNKHIEVRHCEHGSPYIKIVPYTIVPNLLKGD